MKSFLEEYGFAILATIVVILLIMMVSPVGIKIRDSIEGVVIKFSGSAENGLNTANTKLTESLSGLSGEGTSEGGSEGSDPVDPTDPADPVQDEFTVSLSRADNAVLRLQFDGKDGEQISLDKVASFKVNGTELLGNADYEVLVKNKTSWRGVGVEYSSAYQQANPNVQYGDFNLNVLVNGENTWSVTYDGQTYSGTANVELGTYAKLNPYYDGDVAEGEGVLIWEESGTISDTEYHDIVLNGYMNHTLIQSYLNGSTLTKGYGGSGMYLINEVLGAGDYYMTLELNGVKYWGTFTID